MVLLHGSYTAHNWLSNLLILVEEQEEITMFINKKFITDAHKKRMQQHEVL